MVNKIIVLSLLALFVVPSVLAIDTQINIRTLADHKISVFLMESGKLPILESFHINSGSGETSVTYSGSSDLLDIRVKVSKDGVDVINEKFDEFDAGFPAYLQVIPGDVSEDYRADDEAETAANEKLTEVAAEKNDSVSAASESEEVVPEESVEKSSGDEVSAGVSGRVVSEGGIGFSKLTYFIVGGIVLALVILLVVFKVGGFSGLSKKKDVAYNYKPMNSADLDREIIDAEQKIREAKAELSRYKNKEKIDVLRKNIEQQQKELDKLQKGDI